VKRAMDVIDRHAAWVFPLPAILAILILIVGPVLANVGISLFGWSVGRPPTFIGLDNFSEALNSTRFWNGVRNTFYFTGLAVPLQLVLGIALAVLFDRQFPGKGIVRTIMLLPMVATPVAIAWLAAKATPARSKRPQRVSMCTMSPLPPIRQK